VGPLRVKKPRTGSPRCRRRAGADLAGVAVIEAGCFETVLAIVGASLETKPCTPRDATDVESRGARGLGFEASREAREAVAIPTACAGRGEGVAVGKAAPTAAGEGDGIEAATINANTFSFFRQRPRGALSR
jgi:hypothetical protein